jgi:hypothetical protein
VYTWNVPPPDFAITERLSAIHYPLCHAVT